MRKSRFIRLKAFEFSFEGKEKKVVEDYEKKKADGAKNLRKPLVWELHWWVIKGKGYTYHVQVKSRQGLWKKHQREIQYVLRGIKIPQ